MKIARLYFRVSTEGQDLLRQEHIKATAVKSGYYIAGVYQEKASGARADRPELLRMIKDLQAGDVVIAEHIDRISRLPLPEAEKLVNSIREKGARISVLGLVDLSEIAEDSNGVTKVVIEAVQELLLKLALQAARDNYEERRKVQKQGIALAKDQGKYKGRQADTQKHQQILSVRQNYSIKKTAQIVGCSESQVKRVCALNKLTHNKE